MSSELKVGVLFFIGLGLITAFVFIFSNAFHRHGEFSVRFDRIARLEVGDEVTYNGVKIGSISAINTVVLPDGSPKVDVQYTVYPHALPNVLVGEQTEYRIYQGLLGGATLEIVSPGGVAIQPDAKDPPHGTTPSSIDETVSSINHILDENRKDLHGTIMGARKAVENVGEMSGQIRDMVAEDRPHIATTITNVGDMSGAIHDLVRRNSDNISLALGNIKDLSKHLDELVQEDRQQVHTMLVSFTHAGDQIRETVKNLDDMLLENRADIRKTIMGFGTFGPRLDRIGANLELITGQIAAGRGTIGKLVMDDSLHDKALQAVANVNQRMEELKPVTGPLASLKIWGTIESGVDTRTAVSDTYASIRLEPRPWKFYVAGISYRTAPKGRTAAPENPDALHVDFNIQLGWRFFRDDQDQIYRLTAAAGLIDSQLGAWVQAPIIPHHLDVYVMGRQKDNQRQANDRRYESGNAMVRAYLQANLWKERVYLIAGGDDLVGHAGAWFGLRGELLDNDLRNMVTLAGLAP